MAVTIAPVGPEHAAEIQTLASDPSIGATTHVPSPYPEDGAVTWVAHVRDQRERRAGYAFVILDGNRVVGVSSLVAVDWPNRTGSLGYWVGREFRGRGHATAGTRLVLEFAFGELALRRVEAVCLTGNVPSRRVLSKLGFREAGPGPLERRGETVLYVLDAPAR